MLGIRVAMSAALLVPFPVLVWLDAARRGPQSSFLTISALVVLLCGLYQLGVLLIDTIAQPPRLLRVALYTPIVAVWCAGAALTVFFTLVYLFGGTLEPMYLPGYALFGLLTVDAVLMIRGAVGSRP